ncbi:MAG: hypothetical protein NVV74_25705 [Magnetospirillum sp.]|nr:hypothetical protein [Magnetospirillum sp.]
MFAHRDALERRYDGPIPPADPAAPPSDRAARAQLFQRMAREVREQAARMRRRMPAAALAGDPRLDCLQRDLSLYRGQSMSWRPPR